MLRHWVSKWMRKRISLLRSKLTTAQAVLLLPWRRKPIDQTLRKTTIKKQKLSIACPPTAYWVLTLFRKRVGTAVVSEPSANQFLLKCLLGHLPYLSCDVCFLCAQFKVLRHFRPPPPFLLVPQFLPWVVKFPPFTCAKIYFPYLGSTTSPFLLQPLNTHPLSSSPLGQRPPTPL